MQRSALCRSRRELSNAYLLANIGVDTAENEPLKVWGENSIQYSLHSLDSCQFVWNIWYFPQVGTLRASADAASLRGHLRVVHGARTVAAEEYVLLLLAEEDLLQPRVNKIEKN